MAEALTLRLMSEDEVVRLVDWAADEGWNPGLHDARVFWQADPQGFIAAELGDEVVGGGSIVSYHREFGFMGLFLVRPEFRGRGLGTQLWHARLRLLQSRLRAGAAIGMDGVLEMQAWYAEGGFGFAHRSLRYEGTGVAVVRAPGLTEARDVPFERIAEYDRRCFATWREGFLRPWLEQPESLALAAVEEGTVKGYGVIRRCRVGGKIGPLFADDPDVAESLYTALAAHLPGEPVFLDVPEINAFAMGLARRHEMREVFGTARMYLGPRPKIAEHRVYGITTFELG
ncbi:MAG: GNAT family N-acetyltransferase [Candidatus Limnocylindrales bacterium]